MDSAAVLSLLRQAFAFQQHGQLEDAERIYREILTRTPNCFDALHLLGIIEGQ
jgi:hypothetical protein